MVKHAQTIHWLLPTNCLSEFDHISCPYLSKSASLSLVGLILLKLYSFIRLYIVLSAKQIITDISLILKPSSNTFSSMIFGMLNLGALDWLDNFCGVYLPYLEQYTWRLIISLESAIPRSLNSCDDNLQTISDVFLSSKNFEINYRRPNFSDTSTISDWVIFLIAFLMAPKSYVVKALAIDYGNTATNWRNW